MIFGSGRVAAIQPSSLLYFCDFYGIDKKSAYLLLESIRPFLSVYQKNKTPFNPPQGYYFFDNKTLIHNKEEFIRGFLVFKSAIEETFK